VTDSGNPPPLPPRSGEAAPDLSNSKPGFADDFKRFFLRGLAAVMPTLITLWLLTWAWDFLWENLGVHIINLIRLAWYYAIFTQHWLPFQSPNYIRLALDDNDLGTRILGVVLSIVLVYFVGVFVGNLIGRAFWRVIERAVLRIPLVRAIYPAVKQVTDFVLTDRSHQFHQSRVVAVQPHEQNIWSIGFVTNTTQLTLSDAGPEEVVTVFIPSTPTSFSGYVLVVPRNKVVELPMTVEEAMRLLVTGGVIMPGPEAPLVVKTPTPEPLHPPIKLPAQTPLEQTG
jgi:uncharacterized membrane protein